MGIDQGLAKTALMYLYRKGAVEKQNKSGSIFNERPKTPTDDMPLISVAKKPFLVDLHQEASAEDLFLNKK